MRSSAEGERERGAEETVGLSELVDQIFFVALDHQLRIVHEENKAGRLHIDLSEIVDAEAFALDHRRMVCGERFFHEAVQLARGDAAVLLRLHFFDQRKKVFQIFSGLCGDEMGRAVVQKGGLLLNALGGNAPF